MVTHIRRMADGGNVNNHTHRAMRALGVACKQPASTTNVWKGGGRRCICPTSKDRKTDWKCCQCTEWLCKGHSIKTIQIM
jgi:hypothetical protein